MLCTKDWDCQNPMSQTTCCPHHNHQSNSKVQWTTVNLSGTVSAKSTLCFIATGMGYTKPTAFPPSHVFVSVCKLVVTLSLFTHTNLLCICKSNVKCFTEQRTETSSRMTTNTSTGKVRGKKITTDIQTESQLCTGSHIPSAKHSLDCNQQHTMASSILQSNTNHSPLGHLLLVQRH